MTAASSHSNANACVGIIANPVSARDIRRIIANASNLQTSERVNIVLRVLTTLASQGIERVLMMPDRAGISSLLLRNLQRERNVHHRFPTVEFVEMDVTSSVEDTFTAARAMQRAGVKAIVVLGGDGTHRAVVRELIAGTRDGWPAVPIAGLSTGTNNAFPEMREPTIAALAVGLYASGKLTAEQALASNKVLEVGVNGVARDIAIVDAVIGSDRFIGARALWKTDSLSAAYLTFADPQVIGLSAIGGLLHPVGRTEPGGLAIQLAHDAASTKLHLSVPIAPGMITDIAIADWSVMQAGQAYPVAQSTGVVALDGEREFTFDAQQQVSVTLREDAFPTVDVARCLQLAARDGLFRHLSPSP
ncbi:MAG: NAD(+)/NADH kinase [Rhodoferax sp.]|nr:NAD(+)/NADH kinase [Rhodoferax sp.]